MRKIAILLLLLAGSATAQLAGPAADSLELLEELGLTDSGDGGFSLTPVIHGDLLAELHGTATDSAPDLVRLGEAVGVATGMGEGIAGPVEEFLAANLVALAAEGQADVPVEGGFVLSLEVSETDAGTEISWRVSLKEIPAELFPEARHALGATAEDARVTIREFADLQCPHCATFALEAMPVVEELLAEDPGLRFEFHHLPLVTIHANAIPAAEAAECVAAVNGEDSFFGFSRIVFERMQAWQALPETGPYFVSLASETGFETAGVAACLEEREHLGFIRESADTAIMTLGLTGTPSVFVEGFQVGAWNRQDAYERLIRLVDARSSSL